MMISNWTEEDFDAHCRAIEAARDEWRGRQALATKESAKQIRKTLQRLSNPFSNKAGCFNLAKGLGWWA